MKEKNLLALLVEVKEKLVQARRLAKTEQGMGAIASAIEEVGVAWSAEVEP
jgi:hypothetical protein